jgi:hypothetical protein
MFALARGSVGGFNVTCSRNCCFPAASSAVYAFTALSTVIRSPLSE